jgi:hypothetical protein
MPWKENGEGSSFFLRGRDVFRWRRRVWEVNLERVHVRGRGDVKRWARGAPQRARGKVVGGFMLVDFLDIE